MTNNADGLPPVNETNELEAVWQAHNNQFYGGLVDQRGEGWQAFWGSKVSQTGRYDVFLRHLPLSGANVLDVGCGFGDFWAYAQHRGVEFGRYLGVDLHRGILEGASRRYPEAEFAFVDVLTEDPPFRPQYIVASGITAVDFEGYYQYIERIFTRFHELCEEGFAINFLSTCSLQPDPLSRYNEPWRILHMFQKQIDWRCLLVHDYRPNDFTLIYQKSQP